MAARRVSGVFGVVGLVLASVGCGVEAEEADVADQAQALNPSFGCNPLVDAQCAKRRAKEGRRLFDAETFGGNGRTCLTCHSSATGTFSPADAVTRLAQDPGDPLFLHDGLDDGFQGTSRITEHATIRVGIDLPPSVRLKDDPTATSVTFHRGVPTTVNTPALDAVLMYDGRAEDLQAQARGAIGGHAQATVEPTASQVDLIAEFEQSDGRFFSSPELKAFADGGPPPELPAGTTASEKRGRAMFDNVPFNPLTKQGLCATCHSGAMLNEASAGNPFGAPPGSRFFSVGVAERNLLGNPVYTFIVDGALEVTTADPGVMLTAQLPPEFPPLFPRNATANFFKTPPLWGVSRTAPYFHDNSAKTLEAVAEQYAIFFKDRLGVTFTEQDQADMVAFVNLL